jgi:hypothetical protein
MPPPLLPLTKQFSSTGAELRRKLSNGKDESLVIIRNIIPARKSLRKVGNGARQLIVTDISAIVVST